MFLECQAQLSRQSYKTSHTRPVNISFSGSNLFSLETTSECLLNCTIWPQTLSVKEYLDEQPENSLRIYLPV